MWARIVRELPSLLIYCQRGGYMCGQGLSDSFKIYVWARMSERWVHVKCESWVYVDHLQGVT